MTFQEGMGGLQLIAERRIGHDLREAQRREDAAYDRSVDALRREQQGLI